MRPVFYLLFLVLLNFDLKGQAPAAGFLSGKLKDETNNEVIDYAMVNLLSSQSRSVIKSFMTENDGYFQFEDVPPGVYSIKVTFIGYETRIIDNIIISRDNMSLNLGAIKLKQSSNTLDEVVISDTRSAVEFNGDTVTYNVSQSLMAAGSTAVDVLKNVPMVSVDIDGKPSIAGKINTRIFIDGKPSDYTSATITDLMNVLPADAIEKIEVITNPDVKYSADGDGIINIVLKKGYKIGLNGALSLTGSTIGNYNASLYTTYRDDKLSVSVSYGFKETLSTAYVSSLRTNFNQSGIISSYMNQFSDSETGSNGHNGRASVDWDITKKQNIRASANFNTAASDGWSHLDDHRLNSSAVETELRVQDNDNSRSSANGIFNVDYTYKINPKNETLTAGLVYYLNGISQDRDLSRIYHKPNGSTSNQYSQANQNEIKNRRLEFSLDFRKPLTKLSNISVGMQTSLNKNANDQAVYGFDFVNLVDTLKPGLTNEFIYSEDIIAAYGSYNIRSKTRWSLRLGVRSEYTSLNFIQAADTDVNPKPYLNFFPNLALNKLYKKKYNFGLSYSRRITRPREYALNPLIDDANQSNVSFGNPLLKPSFTDQFQFSLGTYGKNWSFTPRVSYAVTSRIIERFRISADSVTYQNLATNRTWTYNMFGNYRPSKKITLAGGLSMSKVSYESKSAIQPNRSGWSYRANGSLTGQFPHQMAAEGQMNYFNNTVSQGRSKGSAIVAFGVRKNFLENKLLVRLLANDPFTNRNTAEYTDAVTTSGATYQQLRNRISNTRNYSLTMSYRFTKVGRNTVNKQKADKEELKTIE
ncbi:TonB-dependent receptor domain-containing protein [Desertivirga xinjiangensis]|uniref:TonB-dependent receptor domain-containing protein n=1 Tax=Desertivirga xinjiangensis TaxID=539206 RepID=UPI00210E00B5|nr:TonB-dependent receptor [Pedobacter xinjiangensis]